MPAGSESLDARAGALSPAGALIEVERVSKRYGDVRALTDVTLAVRPGEIAGFLGPNGAGKSTLLKILATYLPPDAGCVRIAGHDTVRAPLGARRAQGYLPEHNALFEHERVDAFLHFIAAAREVPRGERARRVAEVARRCGLDEVLARPIGACSKGFRQRIGLAAALVHDPPVLLLDEPTHGLDPLQVVAFRDFVRELATAGAGRAVLFSSHVLAEVAQISDRLLVMHRGRLVADAPVTELEATARAAGRSLEAHVLDLFAAAEPARAAPSAEPATRADAGVRP